MARKYKRDGQGQFAGGSGGSGGSSNSRGKAIKGSGGKRKSQFTPASKKRGGVSVRRKVVVGGAAAVVGVVVARGAASGARVRTRKSQRRNLQAAQSVANAAKFKKQMASTSLTDWAF